MTLQDQEPTTSNSETVFDKPANTSADAYWTPQRLKEQEKARKKLDRQNDPNRKRNIRRNVIGGLAGAVALAAVITFLPKGDNNKDPNEGKNTNPVASSTPNPGESQPPSNGETFKGVGEVLKPTETFAQMKAIKNMNVFGQLSFANRFYYYVEQIKATNGTLQDLNLSDDFGISEPESIPGRYQFNIESNAVYQSDPLERAKLYSVMLYEGLVNPSTGETTSQFQTMVDNIEENGSHPAVSGGFVYDSSGPWGESTDNSGQPIDVQNITFNNVNGDNQVISTQTEQVVRAVVEIDGQKYVEYPFNQITDGAQPNW